MAKTPRQRQHATTWQVQNRLARQSAHQPGSPTHPSSTETTPAPRRGTQLTSPPSPIILEPTTGPSTPSTESRPSASPPPPSQDMLAMTPLRLTPLPLHSTSTSLAPGTIVRTEAPLRPRALVISRYGTARKEEVKEAFAPFGEILECKLYADKARKQYSIYIVFASASDATQARTHPPHIPNHGKPIVKQPSPSFNKHHREIPDDEMDLDTPSSTLDSASVSSRPLKSPEQKRVIISLRNKRSETDSETISHSIIITRGNQSSTPVVSTSPLPSPLSISSAMSKPERRSKRLKTTSVPAKSNPMSLFENTDRPTLDSNELQAEIERLKAENEELQQAKQVVEQSKLALQADLERIEVARSLAEDGRGAAHLKLESTEEKLKKSSEKLGKKQEELEELRVEMLTTKEELKEVEQKCLDAERKSNGLQDELVVEKARWLENEDALQARNRELEEKVVDAEQKNKEAGVTLEQVRAKLQEAMRMVEEEKGRVEEEKKLRMEYQTKAETLDLQMIPELWKLALALNGVAKRTGSQAVARKRKLSESTDVSS